MSNLATAIGKMVSELKVMRENLITSYQSTLYDIGSSLVFYTPIKTGLASSNWNVTNGPRSASEREPMKGIKGESSRQAISYQVQGIDVGDTATFYNPIEYIDDLEAGSSRQAPAGMVTPTMTHIENHWIKNLRKNKLIS